MMEMLEIEVAERADFITSEDQDVLPVLEQLEIQDLGELSLIAWRVI